MSSNFTPSIGRKIHRGTAAGAAIVLPAAGAATTLADSTTPPALDYPSGAFQVPSGINKVALWLVYTRGAVGGAFACNLVASNGVEQVSLPVIDQTIDTASRTGFGQEAEFPWSIKPMAPTSAAPVTTELSFDVQPGWTVWLQAAEVGVTATPGTLFAALTGAP